MSKTQKEYKQQTIEATCTNCGKKSIIRKYNYNVNVKNNGYYLCRDCAIKRYRESDNLAFDIEYKYPDEEKKKRAINKLKKNNIILLDYIKDKRGLFPARKSPNKVLKLKCQKCGAEWWGLPRVYLDKNGKCPVCTSVKMSINGQIQKKNLRRKINE